MPKEPVSASSIEALIRRKYPLYKKKQIIVQDTESDYTRVLIDGRPFLFKLGILVPPTKETTF